jgi:HTH-type transcriptional regulator/antitoxin HipB
MNHKTRLKTFEEHLNEQYGKSGSEKRDEFESKSKAFIIGEMLKEARRAAHMTQDQLAEKAGTKKTYISRIENGKIDIQVSTLFRIIEEGLGRRMNLIIR